MATLKELLGDKVRGDGRKFIQNHWKNHEWFEPIFKTKIGEWIGLSDEGYDISVGEKEGDDWHEWPEAKPKKVVYERMYAPSNSFMWMIDGVLRTEKTLSLYMKVCFTKKQTGLLRWNRDNH